LLLCYVAAVFGMSFTELLVLLLLGVIVVGPRQLPGMMRTAGRFLAQGRRWLFDMRAQSGIDDILKAEGLDKDIREFRTLVKGNMVEALTIELDRSEEPERASPADGAMPVEGASAQQDEEKEYPIEGCDSYGARAEDREAYAPVEASRTGEGEG
jgi:sec-independent protein translocase protein TatB